MRGILLVASCRH